MQLTDQFRGGDQDERSYHERATDEGKVRVRHSCEVDMLSDCPGCEAESRAEQPRVEGGGWVMVPVDLTKEMMVAGAQKAALHVGDEQKAMDVWFAMLSAAPQPECKGSGSDTGEPCYRKDCDGVGPHPLTQPEQPARDGVFAYFDSAEMHGFLMELEAKTDMETVRADYVARRIRATTRRTDQPPQQADGSDANRFRFIVEHNWLGATTRCNRGIQDGDLTSARSAVDKAMTAANWTKQADGVAVASVRFTDGDMDFEQLAPMVDGLLYQPPPKSPGVGDETFQVLRGHIDDLRRCVIVLRDYPQLSTVADEFEKAANELTAVLGGEK